MLKNLKREKIAKLVYHTLQLNDKAVEMEKCLIDRHFYRKHDKDAYYGQ